MQALIDVFKPERTFRPQKKFGKGTLWCYYVCVLLFTTRLSTCSLEKYSNLKF